MNVAIHIALFNKSYDISLRTPFVKKCKAHPSARVLAQRDLSRASLAPEVATVVLQLEVVTDDIRAKYCNDSRKVNLS
jgi:hypothetical protein